MKKYIRRGVQIGFFVLVALISVNHYLVENGQSLPFIGAASLHAICPFGSVAGIYQLLTTGTFVKKVHSASLILLYLVLLLSLLFGPVFCGWMCPLGSIQEWFNKLAKKLGAKQKKLPKKLDKYFKYFRVIVLILVVIKTAQVGELMFANIDPYYALFNFWTPDFILTSGLVLMVVLVVNLFIERAWCRYMCPFGALLGFTNKFRLFKLKRQESTCISCQLCTSKCPMAIDIHKKEIVTDTHCISCMECTSERNCPESKTVQLETISSKKTIGIKTIGGIIVIVMVMGVSIASVTGNFATESSKVPQTLADGNYDPADIRGSYGFIDVSEAFNIPLEILGEAFEIEEESLNTIKNKDLELRYHFEEDIEIGNGSVKLFVAFYTESPYDYETSGDYLPKSAIEILKAENKLSEAQLGYLETHSVDLTSSTMIEDDVDEEEIKMSGQTTFNQLLEWGITVESIEGVIGDDLPNKLMSVRDYCTENQIDFSLVKTELQEIIDNSLE